MLLRHWRDRNILCGPLHPQGILIRSEDGDVTVRLAECFHPLVALHAVVETRRHAVDGHVRRGHEAWFAPCWLVGGGVAEGGLNVAVDFGNFEADIGPVWGRK